MFTINKNIFLLSILLANAVYASDPIHVGSATTVVHDVFTTIPTGEQRVQTNDALFFKQQILTKENSTLAITFRDSSTFAVAPQSVVVLDEFVFNPSENVLEKTINMLKGSFRYISGFPIKNSVTKIVTPFGTAGIRGSAVQGTVSQKMGFTVNVGSGIVDFETKDGKKITVREGETLSISAQCTNLPVQPASVSTSMQSLADIFAKTPSAMMTSQQMLANGVANNIPALIQKEAYTTTQAIPVNPQNLQGADLNFRGTGIIGDPQAIIDKLIQELHDKNNVQIDSATRDIVAAVVASDLAPDKITQVAINAIQGAKAEHQLDIAVTILNTLQTLKPALAAEVAPKVQALLSNEQQTELRSLVPNVRFPFSMPENKMKFLR